MTHFFPSKRWISGLLIFLVLAPVVVWFCLYPPRRKVPAQVFFPQRCSGALRLTQPRRLWESHWQGRGAATPTQGVEQVLRTLGKWKRLEKKYGAKKARLRLELIQQAVFTLLGREAWLVMGQWEGQPDEPMGLVALIPGQGVRSRVGPLMELMMEERRLERERWRGVTLYIYRDKRQGHCAAFCELGGWIVASLRQQDPAVLRAIIDQFLDDPGQTRERDFDPLLAAAAPKAGVQAVVHPRTLCAHIRQFNFQRQREMSPESCERLTWWSQRLEGVERVALRQAGPGLADLDLSLEGPRPSQLTELMREESATSAPQALASVQVLRALDGALAQVEMSLPMGRLLLPLAGFSWDETIDSLGWLDLWANPLLGLLRTLFEEETALSAVQQNGRAGLAMYASPNLLLPGMLMWIDQPPLAGPTAMFDWAQQGGGPGPDVAAWIWPLDPVAWASRPAAGTDGSPAGGVYAARPSALADLFVAVDFDQFAKALKAPPLQLLGKKARERLAGVRCAAQALGQACGPAALRLDAQDDRWTLSLRTGAQP